MKAPCVALFSIAIALGASAPWSGFAQIPTQQQQPVTGVLSSTSFLPSTFSFEVWDGLIVVKVNVGDGLPANAVIATGLPLCFASPSFAASRALGADGLRDVTILDRSMKASQAKPQSLRLDKVVESQVPFAVLDVMATISSKPDKEAPQLWLGNSALSPVMLTIDPQQLKITARAANSPLPRGATVVPFEMKDGRMWVELKIGKKTIPALVDTGTVGTLLPMSAAKDLKLTPSATFEMTHPNGKDGKAGIASIPEIGIGDLKLKDVPAVFLIESVKDGFDPDLAIIGNDVLMRYRVTFDYAHSRLAFENLIDPKIASNNTNITNNRYNRSAIQPGMGGITNPALIPRVNRTFTPVVPINPGGSPGP